MVARSHLRPVENKPQSEEDLIVLASKGDRDAFSELFRRHARYIAGVAFKILGSSDEVDDVVQETFIAAHRGLQKLNEVRAFRRWLVTIAVRKVSHRLSQRKLRPLVGLDFQAGDEPHTDPSEAELARELYGALSAMGADLRIPWVLARVEGHKLEDVAVECDASLATIKRRIALAEERLRRRLDHG